MHANFSCESAHWFPQKTVDHLLLPGLAKTKTGHHIISSQEQAEFIIPCFLGQIDDHLNLNSGTIFEENKKNIKFPLKIEAEAILENVVLEIKSFQAEQLLGKNHRNCYHNSLFYQSEKARDTNFVLHKVFKILKMERGYHYILILDITHLNLSDQEKNFIRLKRPKLYANII